MENHTCELYFQVEIAVKVESNGDNACDELYLHITPDGKLEVHSYHGGNIATITDAKLGELLG
jgi:hypothetical protein